MPRNSGPHEKRAASAEGADARKPVAAGPAPPPTAEKKKRQRAPYMTPYMIGYRAGLSGRAKPVGENEHTLKGYDAGLRRRNLGGKNAANG